MFPSASNNMSQLHSILSTRSTRDLQTISLFLFAKLILPYLPDRCTPLDNSPQEKKNVGIEKIGLDAHIF